MFSLTVVVCSILAVAAAIDVKQCSGRSDEGLNDAVRLTPYCKKLPCNLKKGTIQHISIEFTPKEDVEQLENHVVADVHGLNVPLEGIDGESVCDKIESEDGQKTSCPLKAGNKYLYKDSFPILRSYPNIKFNVHWSLNNGKDDIVCFEAPVKIAN